MDGNQEEVEKIHCKELLGFGLELQIKLGRITNFHS
jgi:hypothetical protein